MSESYEDQLSRVKAMAEDGGWTQYISPVYQAALREVLLDRKRLKADLADARAELAAVKVELAKANEDETCRLCGFQPAACYCKPAQGEGE